MRRGGEQVVDFDVHGIVRIRVLGAGVAEERMITRQLGPLRVRSEGDPDIVVRFVDLVPILGNVRLVGLDAGFSDDAFLVLRARHKSPARVALPIWDVGVRPVEIVCERGVPAVPLLVAIVNLTALGRGIVPIHGSAFVYRDRGVLVTGWAKGGKTETLLSFMAAGARYVGDEWVYLDPAGGGRMAGLPEPMRLWGWQLAQMPAFARRLALRDRAILRAINAGGRSTTTLSRAPGVRATGPGRLLRRVAAALAQQESVQVPPAQLFPGLVHDGWVSVDQVVFVMSHEACEWIVDEIDPHEVADRLVASLEHERGELVAAYLKARFGFPGRANPVLEGARSRERELLGSVLAGRPTLVVRHPYPPEIDLFRRSLEESWER